MTEAPKYRIITTSVLASRYNVNGSLARSVLKHLFQKNLIKPVNIRLHDLPLKYLIKYN